MSKRLVSYLRQKRSFPIQLISLCASMILGILVALLLVSRTEPNSLSGFSDNIVSASGSKNLPLVFWNIAKYHIYIALLSTSYLGVVAIPSVLCYKGYLMCLSSAALIFDNSSNGLSLAVSVLGIPALISIPCLLLVASISFESSRELYLLRKNTPRRLKQENTFVKLLICIGILIPLAIFEIEFLPLIVAQILR